MMKTQNNSRLRLAVQKSGRLSQECFELLRQCGLNATPSKTALFYRVSNFPLDLLMVRDDDIPSLVREGICDAGILGEDKYREEGLNGREEPDLPLFKRLGLATCRLCFAVPKESGIEGINQLNGTRIATSFPGITSQYLKSREIDAEMVKMEGSVELAPRLGIAEAISDLVSTGATLEANGMKVLQEIFSSEAIVAINPNLQENESNAYQEKFEILNRLGTRIDGVLKARDSKYIMLHAPADKVQNICDLLPGIESPTTIPLPGKPGTVALHAVCKESLFWETMEALKGIGASAMLVLPIEKMMD